MKLRNLNGPFFVLLIITWLLPAFVYDLVTLNLPWAVGAAINLPVASWVVASAFARILHVVCAINEPPWHVRIAAAWWKPWNTERATQPGLQCEFRSPVENDHGIERTLHFPLAPIALIYVGHLLRTDKPELEKIVVQASWWRGTKVTVLEGGKVARKLQPATGEA